MSELDSTQREPRRTFNENSIKFRKQSDGSLKIIGADKTVEELHIPDSVAGSPVTVIGKGALSRHPGLRSVVVPNSVKLIGAEAFQGCHSLESVELPPDLTVINARTFEGCTALSTVRLPYELTRIGTRAFADCSSLTALPHFIKVGISAVMTVNRGLSNSTLPIALDYIGPGAFSGCTSLQRIAVPFKVSELHDSTFENCTSLNAVWLHSNLKSIGARTFAGCSALQYLRVPESVNTFGERSLPSGAVLVSNDNIALDTYAAGAGSVVRSPELPADPVTSMMGDESQRSVDQLLAAPNQLQAFIERYEVRPPALEVSHPPITESNQTPITPARFTFDSGIYRSLATGTGEAGESDVTLAMVGDLMCSWRQQSSALRDGVYDFTASFEAVKPILAGVDLAIGNMETMVSSSYEYMHRSLYVDDRPHMNSPFAFLAALRQAGFDVVVNAQNHMYDTGTKGLLETLSALNRAELMHTGAFAGPDDQRFLVVEIRGIRVGIVAYLDPARQQNKQANFTDEGLRVMANPFEPTHIRRDIDAARAAGAEFVLAYCHWGREYTDAISARQEAFAQMVVDNGADYVFGSHSHCPQPYTIFTSQDGRRVPVVYSGGNFISNNDRVRPITFDTFIGSLTIGRDATGTVVLKSDGYVPCRIVEDKQLRGYVKVVPCENLPAHGYSALQADEDTRRIQGALGKQYRPLPVDRVGSIELEPTHETPQPGDPADLDRYAKFAISDPPFVETGDASPAMRGGYSLDESSGFWRRPENTAKSEAVILCAGSLVYDRTTEQRGRVGDQYQFRSMFKYVRDCLASGDLVLGSLNTISAEQFPTMSVMTSKLAGGYYSNARPEYLDALRYAGFDCLALANPYNLDAGVRGIAATENALREHSLVGSGLGLQKNPIFDVNGMKIAVLSYTIDAYRTRRLLTNEGAEALLNVFDEDRVRAAVARAREAGAEFILSYLDCRSAAGSYAYADRLEFAKQMAEYGADYVICTLPWVLSRYTHHRTADGREVPISGSLGAFASGASTEKNSSSALLRLVVRRDDTGKIEVEDSYVPLERLDYYRGVASAVVPAHRYYNPHYGNPAAIEPALQHTKQVVEKKLGGALKLDPSRRVFISSPFVPNLSPLEVSRILGVAFTPAQRKVLGAHAEQKLPGIVTRKVDLRPGCAVALVTHTSSRRDKDQMTIADAVEAGARMVISETPHDELPCLVVENSWAAYTELMRTIRDTYDPLTVAITGTAGKTTTKDFMGLVFDRHYRTLHIEGNNNTLTTASLVLQKLTAEDEAYIQEVNGGTPGSARNVSRLIKPHIAIITSIGDGHLDQMGSIENIIKGKMQITAGLREDGVLIVNNDNEYLREQEPAVRTIRYGINDPSCDYYATHVRADGERLDFEIVSPHGTFDVVLNVQGTHNVSNALAVFAAGTIAGIPPHKIVAGLSRFKAAATRQNLVELNGYKLFIDAYNSNILSLTSAVHALCEIQLESGGRRIVVMGDMGEQGDKVRENHELMGRRMGKLPIDLLLCTGGGARYTAGAAREAGLRAYHFSQVRELNRLLRDELRPGDAVLFKAAGAFALAEKVVYPLFGRIA